MPAISKAQQLQHNRIKPTQKQKNEKVCKCGKTFKVKPCHMATRKFCSNECRYKYVEYPKRSKPIVLNCEYCKKDYERFLNGWDRTTKKYCSQECAFEDKKKGENRKCLICGTDFYTSRSRLKKYCSRECSYKSMIDNPRKNFIGSANNKGKNNGLYKHGKYAGRNRSGGDSNKKKVRLKVIELDGHYCFLCGKPSPGLHLHRIVYGSQGGKYEVDNCIQLCGEDHAKVHSSKKIWMPILQTHVKSRELNINGG